MILAKNCAFPFLKKRSEFFFCFVNTTLGPRCACVCEVGWGGVVVLVEGGRRGREERPALELGAVWWCQQAAFGSSVCSKIPQVGKFLLD